MISVPMFDIQGNALEPVEVDESLLGTRVRIALMREAVQMYEANRHVCTKGQLTRAQVAGTTHKLFRQKGTGQARAGSRNVPQRRGGGRAFPANTRDTTYHMPKKARKSAARSALLSRLLDEEVSLINELKLEIPKTSTIARMLEALKLDGRCLMVIEDTDDNLWKSARNIAKLKVRRAADVNAYDLLEPDRVLFTHAAFQRILEALGS